MNWLIIASRSGAKIFRIINGVQIKYIKSIDNPLGRAKNHQLQHDGPGLSRAKYKDASPYSLTGEKNPSDTVADKFANHLSKQLYKDWQEQNFANLTISAEPKFLGRIKKHMDKNLKENTNWQSKDLSNSPNESILKAIQSPA